MRPPTRLRDGLLLAFLVLPAAFGQPAFVSISPSSGSSRPNDPVQFTATFSDTAGAGDILNAQVYVSRFRPAALQQPMYGLEFQCLLLG